mgnify:CR=1 FL=1
MTGPAREAPAGAAGPAALPVWIKIGWTAWLLVWLPLYWRHYGPQNFLWFCDISNVVVGAALWLVSDRARFVTGIVVPVDGGFTAFAGV